ncbi:hypothetical protein C6P46_004870 [Rhodotorula mucilaginosa]|uniref:GC-rich sequence DNA-binding factor n=1 Tax=Rhodotorula mucilaginosa TaxID=5537 RepID=A0A9P7B5P1_RHOMI|nr:hypothetical protein C6P46_004870 [Rhodotorula mucilaginosa]
MQEEEEAPAFVIKKRTKPRSSLVSKLSTSSDATSTSAPTSSALEKDEEEDGNVPVIRSRGKKTPAGRVKARESGAAAARGRISFGGDDDGDEAGDDSETSFVVKRSSNASSSTPRRLLRPSASSTASPNLASSSIAGAPLALGSPVKTESSAAAAAATRSIYSKEYLDELKRSQLKAPKPASEEETVALSPAGYDSLTRSKFGAEQLQESTELPSSQQIERARLRREELRKAGLAEPARATPGNDDGFVSLQVGFASKGGESRLVREEDEIGDGDEDMAAFTDSLSRLPLGKRANADAARRLREEMGEMIDDVEMDVRDEDEEMKEWEEAQIRRAGGGGGGTGMGRDRGGRNNDAAGRKGPYRAAPISARLSAALQALTASHTLEASALEHFEKERAELDSQETELRRVVVKTEEKSRWFGEFKDEVEDWSAFLDEKFPQLERIEATLLSIQRERTALVTRRRFADDADDVALFTGASISPVFRLATAGDGDTEVQGERRPAIASAEEDDLPPPRSIVRTTRRAERERRFRERARPSGNNDGLGYDTDSELSAGDRSDLVEALTTAESDLASLFSDVKAPEFRDPNLVIRRRFEEWRQKYGEEYRMTFAGLSLAQVWEFWARVEMARWNPFELDELPRTPTELGAYQWHQALSTYGQRPDRAAGATDLDENDEEEEEDEDESTEVVNAIVASVAIPRLSLLARQTYDPYSARQTAAALRIVDEISYSVETNSPKFEGLIRAFLFRLRLAIAALQTLILPHLAGLAVPSLAYDPSTFEARLSFLRRCLKLARTCQRWRRYMRAMRIPVVPEAVGREEGLGESGEGLLEVGAGGSFDELVQRELVARTVLPVVEAAWASGGAEIAKSIIEALPKDMPPALRRRLEGEDVGHV